MNEKNGFTIDGITLDPENKEFKYALESVQYTHELIYLTGKAGTGKTTFLKYLRKVSNKKMVVLAPTGVAAVNAKGQTIHSFFHIPISLFVPDDQRLHKDFYDTFHYKSDKIQMIRNMELLVIDEVSMVRCDLLDVVDIILRTIRKKNIPFGGVQVLLIGDTFQLPPVVKSEEKLILYQFYESEFFFSAQVMSQVKPLYIELKKVYRQKEKEFIDVLNRIRVGKQDSSDIQLLDSRINQYPTQDEAENHIILTTTNAVANSENKQKLDAIPSKSSFFEADVVGDFPISNYPTERMMELKEGAQVMFIKNNWEKGYFNGKLGKVAKFNKDSIVVEVTDEYDETVPIVVEPFTWENILYTWDDKEKRIEERVTGTFTQYPLKLAWAITVHKSQGMTFEKVIADVGSSFAAGQVYVALSRCTSMNGLILKSRITPQAIKTDSRVIEFAENEVPETLILEELQKGKADFYYAESRKEFKIGKAEESYGSFVKAIKYRNDIETDLFKRYFCTLVKLYHHNLSKNVKLNETNCNLKEEIADLQSERDKLSGVIETKEEEITELNKAKRALDVKFFEQKKDTERLQKELSNCKSELAIKEGTIIAKENSISSLSNRLVNQREKNSALKLESKSQKSEIESLKREIEKLKAIRMTLENDKIELSKELDRVKNIKWYQKLFGKK